MYYVVLLHNYWNSDFILTINTEALIFGNCFTVPNDLDKSILPKAKAVNLSLIEQKIIKY